MSRSPLYERVESVLAGDIGDGSLPPETQLPPEDGLVERFKVSRTTVRKAIQNLVERGLVEVRRGKGTFVTQPKITVSSRTCGLWDEPRPPDYSTSASWQLTKPSRTSLRWRPGRWWLGFKGFAWPTVWRCLLTRHICLAR
jgi:DNA-binding transcriptional MocR family regulator